MKGTRIGKNPYKFLKIESIPLYYQERKALDPLESPSVRLFGKFLGYFPQNMINPTSILKEINFNELIAKAKEQNLQLNKESLYGIIEYNKNFILFDPKNLPLQLEVNKNYLFLGQIQQIINGYLLEPKIVTLAESMDPRLYEYLCQAFNN